MSEDSECCFCVLLYLSDRGSKKKIGVVVLVVGRIFPPFLFGPPRRRAVLVAIGEPIHCPRIEKPSRELVDHYHAKLLEGCPEGSLKQRSGSCQYGC